LNDGTELVTLPSGNVARLRLGRPDLRRILVERDASKSLLRALAAFFATDLPKPARVDAQRLLLVAAAFVEPRATTSEHGGPHEVRVVHDLSTDDFAVVAARIEAAA
jgi:hypothetical protein